MKPKKLAFLIGFLLLHVMVKLDSAFAMETAFLEVVLYEPDPSSGKYTTHETALTGIFSTAGTGSSAEGEIVQIHPLTLCSKNDDKTRYDFGWVGVVQLEHPDIQPIPCLSVFGKAQRALEKGATAVIFDVTKHPTALFKLNSARPASLDRPIVLVKGSEALQLMKLIRNKKVARARIHRKIIAPDDNSNQYMSMAIFMGCFLVIIIILIVLLTKFKCWKKNDELNHLATDTLHKMKTRKYRKHRNHNLKYKTNISHESDNSSMTSGGSLCAICLEEFIELEVLRVLPCSHEFHKRCVDPWLSDKYTCPLCNFNILDNTQTRTTRARQQPNPIMTSSSHTMTQSRGFIDIEHYRYSPEHYNGPPRENRTQNPATTGRDFSGYINETNRGYFVGQEPRFRELFCDAPRIASPEFQVVPCARFCDHGRPRAVNTVPQRGTRPVWVKIPAHPPKGGSFDRYNFKTISNRHTISDPNSSLKRPGRIQKKHGVRRKLSPLQQNDGGPSSKKHVFETASDTCAMAQNATDFVAHDLPPAYETINSHLPEYTSSVTRQQRLYNNHYTETRLPHNYFNYYLNKNLTPDPFRSRPVSGSRCPSLGSGYLADSPELSDENAPELPPGLHRLFRVTETGDRGPGNGSDTSARSIFGSTSSSRLDNATWSENREFVEAGFHTKNCERSRTPCVSYSSSDGAENSIYNPFNNNQGLETSVDSSLECIFANLSVPTSFDSWDLGLLPRRDTAVLSGSTPTHDNLGRSDTLYPCNSPFSFRPQRSRDHRRNHVTRTWPMIGQNFIGNTCSL